MLLRKLIPTLRAVLPTLTPVGFANACPPVRIPKEAWMLDSSRVDLMFLT